MKITIDNEWDIEYDDVSGIKTQYYKGVKIPYYVYKSWKERTFYEKMFGESTPTEKYNTIPEYWQTILLMNSGYEIKLTVYNFTEHTDLHNRILREWKQNK